jgi:hypothetical protein
MKSQFVVFLKKITILSLCIGALIVISRFMLPAKYFSPALPFILVLFYASNIIVFNILIKATAKRINNFINYFMISSFLKLMLYIVVLSVYVFLNKQDAIPFTIGFFLMYIIFTVFEVTSLLKTNSNKPA